MRPIPILIFIILVFSSFVVMAETPDNPLKNARIGDWVEIQMTTNTAGKQEVKKLRQEIIGKDEKGVKIKRGMTINGRKIPDQIELFALTNLPVKPFFRSPALNNSTPKIVKLGEGDENIIFNGKSYRCHWVKKKTIINRPNQKETIVSTAWKCKEFPLTGIVKRIVERDGTKKITTVEQVTGFGVGK